jgi:hypothetical protein
VGEVYATGVFAHFIVTAHAANLDIFVESAGSIPYLSRLTGRTGQGIFTI